MENNIINTSKYGERVMSTYAEVYFGNDSCENVKALHPEVNDKLAHNTSTSKKEASVWVSPSDLLIDVLELKPPFTSKITRGRTHEGILAIGGDILATERAKFEVYLTKLIHENDAAWEHIMEHEKDLVIKKVKEVYGKILMDKSAIMSREINKFYENTLRDLESNFKQQVQEVLISAHASMVHSLNSQIKEKLSHEKQILQKELEKRYESEVAKVTRYYKLLLNNERLRSNYLVDRAIIERNDVLKAFYREIEAENITSTMYVMCTERKRCKIKQFMLKNYQTLALKQKHEKIKERQDILNIFKEQDISISEINKNWEDKIKSILKLFLKFISFSLKLLPEQASFLLNFEKMVVLQLNEMQKTPYNASSILVDKETFKNYFSFEEVGAKEEECLKEPFVIEGDLSPELKVQYGSRETLPDNEDLPTVRLQRQFLYAKCHRYEEIKAALEAQRCKCMDYQQSQLITESSSSSSSHSARDSHVSIKSESSNDPIFIEDFHRHKKCPLTSCRDLIHRSPFPYLNPDSMLDFDEDKYKRVLKTIGILPKKGATPSIIQAKEVLQKKLPFSATKERYHNVSTQYSSQEDLSDANVNCSCVGNDVSPKLCSHPELEQNLNKTISDNMAKRTISLRRLMQQNPNLMKVFTDESFDFQY